MDFKVFIFNPAKYGYKYFIIMLSEMKPYDIIEDIEEKIRNLRMGEGKILFDTTLGNLDKNMRYVEAYFDGKNIDIFSFKIVKNVPEFFINKSFEYLSEHYDYIENSILTSAEKFKYKHRILT